ncbi:hypothetical protein [Streptomyces flavalbus]|uniref:Dihydrofolate reductase n=1 Tax=Streptomyces flavalbus TaxID=2665155 RepID=A0ABW2WLP6_9ACTN
MPKVRVHNVTISLDGFMAGVNQRADAPFGDGVGWGDQNVGATITGRNMFGPQRGPWQDAPG